MTTAKNVEILTTLEEDPHVTFFPWEIDVQDIACVEWTDPNRCEVHSTSLRGNHCPDDQH